MVALTTRSCHPRRLGVPVGRRGVSMTPRSFSGSTSGAPVLPSVVTSFSAPSLLCCNKVMISFDNTITSVYTCTCNYNRKQSTTVEKLHLYKLLFLIEFSKYILSFLSSFGIFIIIDFHFHS